MSSTVSSTPGSTAQEYYTPTENSPVPGAKSVAIIGAGPVGSLAALYFARDGWNVTVYEHRPDMRLPENAGLITQRSINLAVSERGIAAMRELGVGIDKQVLDRGLPMTGRMLHDRKGQTASQQYGLSGQYINSVDRAKLNEDLMTAAEQYSNVAIKFNHTLVNADLENGHMTFNKTVGVVAAVTGSGESGNASTKETVKASVDLIIGADGAFSAVRRALMRQVRMNFSQEYIEHCYCELTIPPSSSGEFQMANDHLHIWPRHTHMLIALPNPDGSFTCTLFAPFSLVESIKTSDDLLNWFERDFADAIPLMGRDNIVRDFFNNPKGPLISIKCSPYHYSDKCLVIGDAAHAMVPFYGQGMNAGFEDVSVLFNIFAKHGVTAANAANLKTALDEYTEHRSVDAAAICDLAMYNHHEMKHYVTTRRYRARKFIETSLHRLMPNTVVPLYTMVSFSRTRYSDAVRRWKIQGDILLGATIAASAVALYSLFRGIRYAFQPSSAAAGSAGGPSVTGDILNGEQWAITAHTGTGASTTFSSEDLQSLVSNVRGQVVHGAQYVLNNSETITNAAYSATQTTVQLAGSTARWLQDTAGSIWSSLYQ